ncbi:HAD family phosphatase [Bifidobacterium mongoliense]|uniref:HAD family hydrolase n=1 Tax=Bifidobacterium mongoliense TaxID=518643 RepID=UPI0026474D1D|nr:HAD family phosphatase [Bifidobacterium mongoliense]MDN6050873.1 HAD family phosphatase [Bifidobacterium mongoliense]MDN6719764.1 HAD family phosphatase [Bifidobacterium mongoliense]
MKGWPGEPDMAYDVIEAQGAAASASGKPIHDVMFDFGNVLLYWDPAAALMPRYSQQTIDMFLDNDVSGFYDGNDLMDKGATPEEGVAWMRRIHGDRWADILEYYLANFEDSLVGPVPGARVLVKDLKAAGVGVWGLSNWERELFPIAERYCPVLDQLEGRIVSGYVRMRKPDRDIFERAIHDFHLDPASTMFIDDKSMNIVGANAVGIRGVRFSNATRLRELLIESGVDIPAVQ